LFAQHREELIDVFQKVAERGAFIMQNDLVQFEQRLSEYTGIKYVLGVAVLQIFYSLKALNKI
jgi:dTDP-4-amino-4,6-dideoxygalactose transaminase